jgi:hypothetical protein
MDNRIVIPAQAGIHFDRYEPGTLFTDETGHMVYSLDTLRSRVGSTIALVAPSRSI